MSVNGDNVNQTETTTTSRRQRTRRTKTIKPVSVMGLLDQSIEKTVRQFLKNLICGEWKSMVESFENITSSPDDDEDIDYTEFDENDPILKEKMEVHLKYIENAIGLWRLMVHKNNTLTYMSTPMSTTLSQGGSSSVETDTENSSGGENGRSRRRRQKKPSAYQNFCKITRPVLKSASPDMTFGQMAKRLGEMWRALDKDEKKMYSMTTTTIEAPTTTVNEQHPTENIQITDHETPPLIENHDDTLSDILGEETVSEHDRSDDNDHDSHGHSVRDNIGHSVRDMSDGEENGHITPLLREEKNVHESDDDDEDMTQMTQREVPPRVVEIVRDYMTLKAADMTKEEKRMLKQYKAMTHPQLVGQIQYYNIDIKDVTLVSKVKRNEIINALMNHGQTESDE